MDIDLAQQYVLAMHGKGVIPDDDMYWLSVAQAIAIKADCKRRRVGAIVVDEEQRIMGHGYNHSVYPGKSCTGDDCPRGFYTYNAIPAGSGYDEPGEGRCIAIHAEAQALLDAGLGNCRGSTLYCNNEPCDACYKLIRAAGITRVVSPGTVTVL